AEYGPAWGASSRSFFRDWPARSADPFRLVGRVWLKIRGKTGDKDRTATCFSALSVPERLTLLGFAAKRAALWNRLRGKLAEQGGDQASHQFLGTEVMVRAPDRINLSGPSEKIGQRGRAVVRAVRGKCSMTESGKAGAHMPPKRETHHAHHPHRWRQTE